jgi:hypothetical protein
MKETMIMSIKLGRSEVIEKDLHSRQSGREQRISNGDLRAIGFGGQGRGLGRGNITDDQRPEGDQPKPALRERY